MLFALEEKRFKRFSKRTKAPHERCRHLAGRMGQSRMDITANRTFCVPEWA
jgi:hypothetical protein